LNVEVPKKNTVPRNKNTNDNSYNDLFD
jgi:hypothetical protein